MEMFNNEMTMEEKLISLETAKLAKEKGYYNLTKNIFLYDINLCLQNTTECYVVHFMDKKNHILAPTQSLLQRWLREVHKIHIIISSPQEGIWKYHIPNIGGLDDFSTYEEALEEGLLKALKMICPNDHLHDN